MEKKKVMVIDDEKDFLKMMKMNLEQTDKYDVLGLSSAKDIIHQVHKFNPDIILLDILMPTIGGIEACEMLNNDSVGSKIPIVVITALNKDKDQLKAYKAGVVDYLVKPIEIDEVVAKIEKALQFK